MNWREKNNSYNNNYNTKLNIVCLQLYILYHFTSFKHLFFNFLFITLVTIILYLYVLFKSSYSFDIATHCIRCSLYCRHLKKSFYQTPFPGAY